jgi:hypothetical protein
VPSPGRAHAPGQTTRLDLPGQPLGVAFNTANKKAYFACASQSDAGAGIDTNLGIAVVDDATNKVTTTISTKNLVRAMATNAATNKLYVADYTGIDVVDGATDMAVSTIDMTYPDDLAVDATHNKVYVLSGQRVLVVDGASNMVVATYPIPINATGSVTAPGVHHIAVDEVSQKVFVVGQDASLKNSIITLDGTTGSVTSMSSPTGFPGDVLALGNGQAAVMFPDPSVQLMDDMGNVISTVNLGTFTPSSFVAIGMRLIFVGTDGDGTPGGREIYFSPSRNRLRSIDIMTLNFASDLVLAAVFAAAPVPTGSAFYVTLQRDPHSPDGLRPGRVFKINLSGG